jgi:pyruvate formate lyase activating enzyme
MSMQQREQIDEPVLYPATRRLLDATLWRTEGQGVRCLVCTRRCLLHDGQTGFCTAVDNRGGRLYSTAYGVVGEASVSPVESRPVYHYRPGSRNLGLGGLGCNLRCAFCQNWEVAFRDARHGGNLPQPNVLPERAVALALSQGCAGIAWTFNEPTITPLYVYDCARLAHEAGLYTVFVTNGFLTRETLRLLGPHLDVYRVDVKSLDASFYQLVAGTDRHTEMFSIAREAQQEYGIHIETVTNLMPSLNESDEHLLRLAERLLTSLGPQVPWHLTTYIPYAHMTHIPPTPPETLQRARTLALSAGLRFVYTDNPATPETAHTFCSVCKTLVIERHLQQITIHALGSDGSCTHCGAALGIVVSPAGCTV